MLIKPFGDATWVDLEIEGAPDRGPRTHAFARALAGALPGAEVIEGAGVVLVTDVERALVEPAAKLALAAPRDARAEARLHVVRAIYDGPDLDEVADLTGLSREEVIERHVSRDYDVELTGFLPGFAYLGPIDPKLVVARRAAPRKVVEPRSIGIAGQHTGIYALRSPGGWNLLGRALTRPFDARREPPSLFVAGDRVRFERASDDELPPSETRPSVAPSSAKSAVRVVAAAPGITIQDLGRRALHLGLPPSGALDRATLVAANRAVGNEDGAAAIEIPIGSLQLRAVGEQTVSIDGERSVSLADGEALTVGSSEHAVRYLAIRGGVDVPIASGSRSALVVAGYGGLEGRPLRARDVIPIGAERGDVRAADTDQADPSAPLVVLASPHEGRFPKAAMEALLGSSFRVSRIADRVGARLEGAPIPREGDDLALPAPMLRGALQVTTDGTVIVLGPDHPVTGGYPVIGVLDVRSQDAFARLRPGAELRFTRAR